MRFLLRKIEFDNEFYYNVFFKILLLSNIENPLKLYYSKCY